ELLAARCPMLGPGGLAPLLANCRRLVSLDLTRCPGPGQLATALARRTALCRDGFDRFPKLRLRISGSGGGGSRGSDSEEDEEAEAGGGDGDADASLALSERLARLRLGFGVEVVETASPAAASVGDNDDRDSSAEEEHDSDESEAGNLFHHMRTHGAWLSDDDEDEFDEEEENLSMEQRRHNSVELPRSHGILQFQEPDSQSSANGDTAGPRRDYLSWEDHFMAVACLSGQRSKDPVTQVGCCIVDQHRRIVAVGYNGMPTGCHDDLLPWGKSKDPTSMDSKHLYVCCTIYVALFPCNECAKLIIQSGIKEVVYLSDKHRTKPATKAAKRMLAKAGVSMCQFESKRTQITVDFDQSAVDFKKSLLRLAESLDCPVAGQELRLMDQLHVKYCTRAAPFSALARVRQKNFRRAIIDNGNDDEQRRLRDFVRSLIDANSTPEPRRRCPGAPPAAQPRLMEVQPAADRCARLLLPYLAMGHLVRLYTVLLAVLARCRVLALANAAVAAEVYASLRRRLTEFPPSDGAACAAARRLGKRAAVANRRYRRIGELA
uniref:dCMP deaminase n=1 Tax=Macrostomum lignano TaxID=282301 RepID=A0A1I8FIM2_9PLAT